MKSLKPILFIFFVSRFFFDVNAMESGIKRYQGDNNFFNLFSSMYNIKFDAEETEMVGLFFRYCYDNNFFEIARLEKKLKLMRRAPEIVCAIFAASIYCDEDDFVGAVLFAREKFSLFILEYFFLKDVKRAAACKQIFVKTLNLALANDYMKFLASFYMNAFYINKKTTDCFSMKCKEIKDIINEFLCRLKYEPARSEKELKMKIEIKAWIKGEIEAVEKMEKDLIEIRKEEIFKFDDLD